MFTVSFSLVDQMFVWGDRFKSYLVCVLVLNEEELRNWAKQNGLKEVSLSTMPPPNIHLFLR